MDAQDGQQTLFPKIEPFGEGMLSLGGGQEMYWEQSGNPDGVPVVFLQGPTPPIAVFSTPKPIASSSSTNGAPGDRSLFPNSPTTRRTTLSMISRLFAVISASTAG